MRKTVFFMLCLGLLFGTQALANTVGTFTPLATRAAAIPATPDPAIDETDSIIFFENFESGAPGWTFVDLTDAPALWHIDDYNHYTGGGSTLSWWSGDTTIMGYRDHTLEYLVSPTFSLVGAVNPTLTFNLFHSVETPPGATPPYDGWDACNIWISTNNGSTWSVLPSPTPAYNMTSSYAFGYEFGMGPGIAGWGGYSGGVSPGAWVNASKSLSAYVGNAQVKIRFAMCSDPAYSTAQDSTLRGMFVDNVLIQAGVTTLLQNNAEGIAVPSQMIPTPAMTPVGNFWHVAAIGAPYPTPPSPTHVAWMANAQNSYLPMTYCAIVSPNINLTGIQPGSADIYAMFFHHGNINVGDPQPFPDLDIWTIEVSPDNGVHWYNWNDPWNQGALHYVFSSLPVGWDSLGVWSGMTNGVDVSDYAGYNIKIRVYFQADPDNYLGYGMMIDNFRVYSIAGLAHDVGAKNLLVPMPTSVYFDTIHCSVRLHNFGTNNEPMVPAFWRVNYGTGTPLIPWASINAGQFVTKTFNWVTPAVGNYYFDSWTALTSDMLHTNDSAKAGTVELTAANVFEFGYDNRQYGYESNYYFNFDPGEGAYVKYTPTADGCNFNMNAQYLRARFMDAGSIRIHIYQPGTATTPGPEVTNFTANVTSVTPNWQQFSLTGVSYLQNTHTDFWVFYEMIDTSSAHILGDDIVNGAGHFFANFGSGMTASDYDFFARAVFNTSTAAPALDVTLTPVNPPIVIPAGGGSFQFNATVVRTVGPQAPFYVWARMKYPNGTYSGPTLGPVQINPPVGATITRLRNQNIAASHPAGVTTYLGYANTASQVYPAIDSSFFTFTKTAVANGGPMVWDNLCSGEPFPGEIMVSAPASFAMVGANPNPFNPATTLSFSLPEVARVTLNVFDVQGRLVATLVNGLREAGQHQVTFDGSNLSSGVYLYTLTAGSYSATGKMVLMK
jgi:hypothetical protein